MLQSKEMSREPQVCLGMFILAEGETVQQDGKWEERGRSHPSTSSG
jgi:hypothetical protein